MTYENVGSIRCRFHNNKLHCDVTTKPNGPQEKVQSPIVADEVDVNSLTADIEQYTGQGIQYDFSDEVRVLCEFTERNGGDIFLCKKR